MIATQHTRALVEAIAPPEYRGIARDAVRMLVTDRNGRTHRHARFCELPSFLRAGDLLIVNDSRTLPASILAHRRSGEEIRLNVSTMIDERLWTAEPRGTVVAGEELHLPEGASATMLAPVDRDQPRLWYASFDLPSPMYAYLLRVGEPIRYGYVKRDFPLQDYQTVFSREQGSAEMPSAARPFSARVVCRLRDAGVEIAPLTLHCGVASFEAPERPATERFSVSHATAHAVNAARQERRRVIAVGTTVVRALESAAQGGVVRAASGWTDLVIDENHELSAVDALLTGFHAPMATHLWMLNAFLDADLLRIAYDEAADCSYHYHEFGDVHLIL